MLGPLRICDLLLPNSELLDTELLITSGRTDSDTAHGTVTFLSVSFLICKIE